MPSSDGNSGEFQVPSPELIEEVLVRIGDLQHRRVFYDGLANPNWVKPLAEANAFGNVPTTAVDPEGYLRTTPWPEGDYLVRMAPHVPEEVAQVLEPLKETGDPYVQRVILRAATHMPAGIAREYVPTITRLIDGPLGRLVDPQDWVALVATLAADDATARVAMALANALYRPKAGPPDDRPYPRQRAVVGLKDYAYRRSMPALREALAPIGLKTLTQLKIWLEEYQVHSGNDFENRKRDVSTMWRPSIRPHEQNQGYDEVGEALVDAVRDEATSLLERGIALGDVLATLQSSEQPLIQRIALHVVSVSEAASETGDGHTQRREHLFDRSYLDDDFRNEYAHLARAVFPSLSDEETAQWLALIAAGPFQDLDWIEERAGRFRQEGESVKEVVQRYREVWRRDVLASIGSDQLPDPGAELLADLVEKWGAPHHPEFPNWVEFTEVTPRGAEAAAKLESMSATEVVALLREWTPEGGSSFDEPTIEGQARALQSDVRKRPAEYVQVASEFAQLDPTYVRALFSGLAETIREHAPADWTPLVQLAESVAAHDEQSDHEVQRFDRDGSWQFAQREVLRLIAAALKGKPNDDSEPPLNSLVEVVASLTESPDPTLEYEAQYGGDNMDPLTLSLNGVRPAAVAQLADILLHIHVRMAEGRIAPDGISGRIEAVLESRMGAAIDPSLAVAAAFGRSIGKFIDADDAWAMSILPLLLGEPGAPVDAAYTDIVVSTALATYHPSLKLVTFLADYYAPILERAARGESVAAGWHRGRTATELLGDHIVVLLVRGELEASHPLVSGYFANTTVHDRASVLGHLGWGLGREDELPANIIERARELMDARVASVRAGSDVNELSGLGWWAMANHFAPEWWLPIVELAATGDNLDPRGMIGEALEKAADVAPSSALSVLKALLSRHTEPFERIGLIDHAPGVIAAALDSTNEQIVDEARALLDQLGRQGELRLGDLVEKRRKMA